MAWWYDKPSQIDSTVFLGSVDSAADAEFLNKLSIKRILTVDIEPLKCIKEESHKHFEYLFIEAMDHPQEDLISRFVQCFDFLNDGGDKVLVHCHAGVSRSATIVIAYLMIKKKICAEKAKDLVHNRRQVRPNNGFLRQLKLFEQMGFTLDWTNGELRRFLLSHLKFKMNFKPTWRNADVLGEQHPESHVCLENYLKKLGASSEADSQQDVFRCKKCRSILFHQKHVISNSSYLVLSECDKIFVEPQEWMKQFITQAPFGRIFCPKCAFKLGYFNWDTLECDCILHVDLDCLLIRIDAQAIDFQRIDIMLNNMLNLS